MSILESSNLLSENKNILVKFNSSELVQLRCGLPNTFLNRPELKQCLIVFFNKTRQMEPPINLQTETVKEEDIPIFIFIEETAKRTRNDYSIDILIQRLAAYYLYTGQELALNQLVILLLNRIMCLR